MKTYPLAGYVVIVSSAQAKGKATQMPSSEASGCGTKQFTLLFTREEGKCCLFKGIPNSSQANKQDPAKKCLNVRQKLGTWNV